ncbi:MAG: hypothetical protein DHS20C10_13800 [marine bacterium B5-7]|nr:MAG: hypothetical protein DHS20C10_13800 [marine bacterium B5-7]
MSLNQHLLIYRNIISEMQEKIKQLKVPKNFSCLPVLIHVNGTEEIIKDSHYFSVISNFSDFIG